jgi:two-component system alkaline phosphatase synthesis response regulator PhoP/two-component system response regulator VicR
MAKRILVVEDDGAVARLIQVNLERAGYEVELAGNGRGALTAVAQRRPDAVVLDVVMPVLDGFEVLRRLKADPDTSDIPVMLLTGKSDEDSIFQAWSEGVECYLTKPFDPDDLVLFMERMLAGENDEAE